MMKSAREELLLAVLSLQEFVDGYLYQVIDDIQNVSIKKYYGEELLKTYYETHEAIGSDILRYEQKGHLTASFFEPMYKDLNFIHETEDGPRLRNIKPTDKGKKEGKRILSRFPEKTLEHFDLICSNANARQASDYR